jgi:uncharacterized membrane protein
MNINATRVLALTVLALVIDIPWLYLNHNWSAKMIRSIQGSPLTVRAAAALPVYLAIGFLISIARTPIEAAAIGAAAYAIYDFTNYATLANYDLTFAIVDVLWGATLFFGTFTLAEKIGLFRPRS